MTSETLQACSEELPDESIRLFYGLLGNQDIVRIQLGSKNGEGLGAYLMEALESRCRASSRCAAWCCKVDHHASSGTVGRSPPRYTLRFYGPLRCLSSF